MDGRVQVDRVLYQVIVEIIFHVIEIPDEGLKFYRDKKVFANVVKDFAKNMEEKKELVKSDTYYEMESIKKLWRYVLRAIIEYISLDMRFDRVRTHHFFLLNHFCYGVKVSFPFYLYSSMHKNIFGYKKKPSANPALHEGLLLLLYEHFKAQSRSKSMSHVVVASEETGSYEFS